MKKILLATTVLAAAGFTTSASAAEWSTTVNGYWFVGIGFSDANNQQGPGVLRDGEIHFRSQLKADNGLTFTSRVELESFSSGDQIDENWASVSGSFGTVMIGGNDDAVYNNHVGVIYAPGARIGYYDNFDNFTAAAAGGFNRPGHGLDDLGIHYTTPSFAGAKAAFTYIPRARTAGANNGTDNGGNDTNNPVFSGDDLFAASLSYNGDFDGFGVGVSAGYTDIQARGDVITLGANVGASGFKIAGTYQIEDPDVGGDGETYAIGLQYSNGPITVGGGYTHTDSDAGSVLLFGAEEEEIVGWVTYSLAPGVSATAGLSYSDAPGVEETLGGLAYLALSF